MNIVTIIADITNIIFERFRLELHSLLLLTCCGEL